MNKNEPSGEVFTSANSSIESDIPHHPRIIQDLKDLSYDLHKEGITHVLPNEDPPAGAQPVITYMEGQKVAVKDLNGMTGEPGRYYIHFPKSTEE